MQPIFGAHPLARPVVLAYLAFAIGSFWLAKRTSVSQFAFLLAALAIGCQLWKIHGTATYMAWYYPLLLVGLLTAGPQALGDRQLALRKGPEEA